MIIMAAMMAHEVAATCYPPVNRDGDVSHRLRRVLVAARPPRIGGACALARTDTVTNPGGRAAPSRPRPAGRCGDAGDGGRWTPGANHDVGSTCRGGRTLRPGSPPRVGGCLAPT